MADELQTTVASLTHDERCQLALMRLLLGGFGDGWAGRRLRNALRRPDPHLLDEGQLRLTERYVDLMCGGEQP